VAFPSPLNSAWKGKVLEKAANVLIIPSTRARPSTIGNTSLLPMTTVGDADADKNENQLPNKRQRVDIIAATACSYWPESPEAYQLFTPRRGYSVAGGSNSSDTMDAESPQEAVERRIIQLQAIHESVDSWRGVVKGGDADNYCTKAEIFEIRQRAMFLCFCLPTCIGKHE
jgi:hypothetical protein